MFITGVSPVVLSDMTSGYNVGEDIYLKAAFSDLCGFTEAVQSLWCWSGWLRKAALGHRRKP